MYTSHMLLAALLALAQGNIAATIQNDRRAIDIAQPTLDVNGDVISGTLDTRDPGCADIDIEVAPIETAVDAEVGVSGLTLDTDILGTNIDVKRDSDSVIDKVAKMFFA